MTKPPRHWEPLIQADYLIERPEVITMAMKHYGITAEQARARIQATEGPTEYWINRIYQVQLSIVDPVRGKAGPLHLNIRRRDGGPNGHDWRHFQEIKNQLAGPEREGLEIYPAESRKVDTSNKWHLWVLPEGVKVPVGWEARDVQYEENRNTPGIRQRPL